MDYAFPWSGLINAYKSQGDVGLGHGFAALMHSNPVVSRLLRKADAWVGVPLSDRAWSGRGFHQTADLITQLRHQFRLPPPEIRHALSRLGTNKAQKALGLHARADNLSGTFMVNASAIHGIEGRHALRRNGCFAARRCCKRQYGRTGTHAQARRLIYAGIVLVVALISHV